MLLLLTPIFRSDYYIPIAAIFLQVVYATEAMHGGIGAGKIKIPI